MMVILMMMVVLMMMMILMMMTILMMMMSRSLEPENRFSATTTLTVHVRDSDDLDPAFPHMEYAATVVSGVNEGVLAILPEKIMAEDQDTIRNEILYSFVEGTPNFFGDYFAIDQRTGIGIGDDDDYNDEDDDDVKDDDEDVKDDDYDYINDDDDEQVW